MTLQQQLESGMSHHQAGRLAEAERIYRRILTRQPDHADALHLLGVLAVQTGRLDEAEDLIRRAISICSTNALYYSNLGKTLKDSGQLDQAIASYRHAIRLKPDYAEAHNNLGNGLRSKGQLDEAIAAFRQAIRLKPDLTEAHYNLGNAMKDNGQLDEAIAAYRQATRLKPQLAEAHYNLGNALKDNGQIEEAIASHRHAIQLKPGYAKAHYNLGIALQHMGQLDEAVASFRQAVRLKPDLAEAHNNLGIALKDKGQVDEAIVSYRQAVRFDPDYAEAHSNLGIALQGKGQLDEALAACRQAIRLKPELADAHNNLGNVFKDIGQLDEAIASFRQAIRLKPDDAIAHDNLVYTLLFQSGYDARMSYEEARRWNRQHAEPLKKFIHPHHNNRDPARCLRIGYVSSDFHSHASALFLLPLFRHHDRRQVEVFCYSLRARSDTVTQQLKDHVQHWRTTVGLPDAKVAAQVREDQIDILVDLKLHTGGNRLLIFAEKPAPVQATWLGYPGTTGLDAMDYRLTDPYLDPPGLDDACYSERSIRLPDTFWCYDPLTNEPAVNAPPCLEKGFVTFGCLNNFCKVTDVALTLWAGVLNATSNARLLLLAPEGSSRQRVLDRLSRDGIDPKRVEFVARQSRAEYLNTYRRIEISLDTVPCNGHSTSLDSFWMGVPVVTLVGRTVVGRAGLSQLTNLGLPELIAQTPEHYVKVATDLARDLPRLAELRRTLRARMEASPLMDAPRFARNVESAYRSMWTTWCGQNSK
jgi:predicted O-linked N-acetylglucosamine transferase (SPINDLY family)